MIEQIASLSVVV